MDNIFVITAKENGSTVYYAIDAHSGGYPYWSSSLNSAKQFSRLPDFFTEVGSCISYLNNKVKNIQICKVSLTCIEKIDIENAEEVKKEKRRRELQEQIAKAQQELNNL